MKKLTLVAAMLVCCCLSVMADGDQPAGNRSCQTTCTNSLQTQTSETSDFYVKFVEFIKFFRF